MIPAVLFWLTCALTLAGAAAAALARNLLHAALGLGLALTGVAGLYLFLQAEYLAVVQLMVYVGGVLILVVFGVFLSRDLQGREQRPGWQAWGLGLAGFVAASLVASRLAVAAAGAPGLAGVRAPPDGQPELLANGLAAGAPGMGEALLGPWLVPFLALGLLLTLVTVGAVAIVRARSRPENAEGADA